MQRLVEQFDDPAYVVRFDGVEPIVEGWNPADERAFGYTAEEAVGRNIDEMVRSTIDVRSRLRRIVELQRRGLWIGRTTLLDRRGKPLAFHGSCHRLADGRYLTVLRFRPIDFATTLREFAQSGAQSERRSVGERRSGCNGDEAMTEYAKQHRKDKTAYHLRRLRERDGLNPTQLENRIGATRGHVSRWESAEWEPGAVWMAELCKFFHVEEAEFYREPVEC
jgi:PAS domain S-box-containing protein